MKPYVLAAYNFLRLGLRRCRGSLQAPAVTLLSYDTKLRFGRSARVRFGTHLVSDGRTVMVVDEGAALTIGNNVYMNEGAMISVKSAVTIADGCRFGPNVKIFDNDHCFDAASGVSAAHRTAPVVIGEGCWLAANVVVLRGTTIGKHCVIGANCVVYGNIPDGSVVTQARELTIQPIAK